MNPICDHETPLAKSKSHGVFFGGFFGVEILRSHNNAMGLKVILLVGVNSKKKKSSIEMCM